MSPPVTNTRDKKETSPSPSPLWKLVLVIAAVQIFLCCVWFAVSAIEFHLQSTEQSLNYKYVSSIFDGLWNLSDIQYP
eukprot:UN06745